MSIKETKDDNETVLVVSFDLFIYNVSKLSRQQIFIQF